MAVKVLFVCLGNICRSPTAHGVFQHRVAEAGLQHSIEVDSAGTGGWHIGEPPDKRAIGTAKQRGYDLSPLRARQFSADDLQSFDYVLAMDQENLQDMLAAKRATPRGHVGLFLEFDKNSEYKEVPDPYFGGAKGFERVLDLIESASQGLLEHIQKQHL